MVSSAILLVSGVTASLCKKFQPLSRPLSSGLRRILRKATLHVLAWLAPERPFDNGADGAQRRFLREMRFHLVFRPALAIVFTLRLFLDLFNSTLTEGFWILVPMLWGTLKLAVARTSPSRDMTIEENRWSFG
ncbi:hypothetical protein HRG_012216 [Hirsutella rhossiliensis]